MIIILLNRNFTVFLISRENQLSSIILLALTNDIYSYNKRIESSCKGNIVHQLQRYAKYLPHTAMAVAKKMFDQEKQTFDQNCEEILKKYDGNREVLRYFRSIRALIVANVQLGTNYQPYTVANDKAAKMDS